ncbi:hypothetical protein F53441_1287 [Fusarium austroafricanum]|uniref:Uncharacterized protein n=1 Tax=Fusarium austroafricanum TaxID=2364996 RepID=A0A8H4NZ63_9HYPO|nr:hypothetical protein F53441_1287 [Fusarium austroafricanum]
MFPITTDFDQTFEYHERHYAKNVPALARQNLSWLNVVAGLMQSEAVRKTEFVISKLSDDWNKFAADVNRVVYKSERDFEAISTFEGKAIMGLILQELDKFSCKLPSIYITRQEQALIRFEAVAQVVIKMFPEAYKAEEKRILESRSKAKADEPGEKW